MKCQLSFKQNKKIKYCQNHVISRERWKILLHITHALLLQTLLLCSRWAHHHHWNIGLVPITWHILTRSAQKGIISILKPPLPLPGAILAHFFSLGFPPLLTLWVFYCGFFSPVGKEELLILMGVTEQQKVHQRLPKGQWCVVCLSLMSAGFGMSQENKLGNKQVGELIDQLVAWQGCVRCWLRDLINVLSFLTPSSSSIKPPRVLIRGLIPPSQLHQEHALEPSAWETDTSSPCGRNTQPMITHIS